jgi:hypothetical protein
MLPFAQPLRRPRVRGSSPVMCRLVKD